jgi:hypothetical protein
MVIAGRARFVPRTGDGTVQANDESAGDRAERSRTVHRSTPGPRHTEVQHLAAALRRVRRVHRPSSGMPGHARWERRPLILTRRRRIHSPAPGDRSWTMKKVTLTLITAAGLALSGTAFLGCDSTRTRESTGEYIDDTVVTTRVQAAILKDPLLKPFQIGVRTFRDTVQLSGFVDTAQAAKRAGEVALGVHGVAKVKNDLIVK